MSNPQTLRAYAESHLRRVGANEFHGPCPWCQGEDRFLVGFDKTAIGKCKCRQGDCTEGEWKSGPWFTSKLYGISYPEARKLYGLEAGTAAPRRSEAERQAERAQAVENSLSFCRQKWSGPAAQVLARFQQGLYGSQAAAYLRDERRLTGKTCVDLGFGFNAQPLELQSLGHKGRTVFPVGVVMPVFREASLVGMVIRREKPWIPPGGKKEVRFHDVWGGPKVPFLCGPSGGLVVVVEGIIDAASVYQASRGKFGVVAICGNDMPLDRAARDMLTAAKVVLIAKDTDNAGRQLEDLVRKVRPKALAEGVPEGKDANGYLVAQGENALSRWLLDTARRALENEKVATIAQSEKGDSCADRGADFAPMGTRPTEFSFFAPDMLDGLPVCYLPQEVPDRLRGIMPPDLRGLGVPTQGLPLSLRGISACGWTLAETDGRLELRKARPDARNEEGVRGYLRVHCDTVAGDWKKWAAGCRP